MDTRKTILIYQYAERIKSELIIASQLLAQMVTLESEERKGAEKLMTSFLEALVGEIRIAKNIAKSINFLKAEGKLIEAIGRIKLSNPSEVNRCISEALSLITTSCQEAMTLLEGKHLL